MAFGAGVVSARIFRSIVDELFGEFRRRHREIASAQLTEHEIGAWHVAVVDVARDQALLLVIERADLDLERDHLVAPHEVAQEFEGIRLRDDIEPQIGARHHLVEQLPPADAALWQRHRIGGAIAKPQIGTRRERMIARHQRDQALLERHQWLEIGEIGRAEHEHEIDFVVRKLRHRAFVVEHAHVEMHQRKARAEIRDLARQEIERQRLAAGDAHGAAAQTFQILDLRFHQIDVGGLFADVADEQFAGRRQPHAARLALEQFGVELFLEIHDPPVDGGGCDIEVFGGLSDRSGARDLIEIAEKTQMSHRLSALLTGRHRFPVMPFRHHSNKKTAADRNTHLT